MAWFTTVWVFTFAGSALSMEVHMEVHVETCLETLAGLWSPGQGWLNHASDGPGR